MNVEIRTKDISRKNYTWDLSIGNISNISGTILKRKKKEGLCLTKFVLGWS
jgi:hypothetical protein